MYNENYLAHYGTPGMRWGQRRTRKAIEKYSRKADAQARAEKTNIDYLNNLLKKDYNPISEEKLTKSDKDLLLRDLSSITKSYEKWNQKSKEILNLDPSKIDRKQVKAVFDEWKIYGNGMRYHPFET